MSFELPPLPYGLDSLAPHVSKETLEYHYGKHHAAYVTNLNQLLKTSELAGSSLEELILKGTGPLYNNAAQVWNHTFYWNCLSPKGGGQPTGPLLKALEANFGSFTAFQEKFNDAAKTLFGSGWVFLVELKPGQLNIVQEGAAGNPLKQNMKPLMTCDVWEHAYYIDFRNARPSYLEAFWKLVHWDFVAKNLG
jgi:Fe-Mn family superoxide dismutase